MSEQQQQPAQPTEDELRAAYEEQLKQIRVDDVLVQTVLSLINLGSLRAGLVPGNESEADPAQLRQAIEGVRALLPLVEPDSWRRCGPDPRRGLAAADGVRAACRCGDAGARAARATRRRARRTAADARRTGTRRDQRKALGSGALARHVSAFRAPDLDSMPRP